MENDLQHNLEALRKLRTEAGEILATRKSHTAPLGVIAILPDTVDSSRAQAWFVRAKSIVADVFGRDSDFYESLAQSKPPEHHSRFKQAAAIVDGALEEASRKLGSEPQAQNKPRQAATGSSVFVVHGHDHGTMHMVARFLEKLKLVPIVLHEQANGGRTIIEKFETHSAEAACAIVLLTPDDVGGQREPAKLSPRARQNVVFEHGFFVGALGRRRVIALRAGEVEIPSDLSGVLYVDMVEDWKLRLAKELKTAGLEVDMNAAV